MDYTDKLAGYYGIEETAVDARGRELNTSAETRRSLLSAMGVDVSSDSHAQTALERVESASWRSALPAVLVVDEANQPIRVSVVMPRGTESLSWMLQLEQGSGLSKATLSFSELELLEERQRGDETLERRQVVLPDSLAWGYHNLKVDSSPGGSSGEMSLIVTPGRCWLPEALESGRRVWGIAAQLYLQRSAKNWGIGDFSDLQDLVTTCRESGADVVGLNPLHAMFPDRPEDASPYSPSDRTLLNILYIDVEAIPEYASSEEARGLVTSLDFKERLRRCRSTNLVDYTEAAKLKLAALGLLFKTFNAVPDVDRFAEFEAFHRERPVLLDRACLFQALQAHFASEGISDSPHWPAEYQAYDSPAVQAFAREHSDLVRFQLWLQWVADTQLKAAHTAADSMMVGLYRDLAVGVHSSGAEGWAYPNLMAEGVQVGAPPDVWNPSGQNWGLPAMIPQRLTQLAYKPFVELLQANMRYAGAIRIDHALSMQRLYWIPAEAKPSEGAYVHYPMEDLIRILALESHRNHCLVIGEDLGTVPEGFRERMAEANVLSYRVLLFEKEKETFFAPDKYPSLSLSVASSHDLPTLQGWLREQDIHTKDQLHLFPTPELAAEAREQRKLDREALGKRFASELTEANDLSSGLSTSNLCSLVHDFLAKTKSMLTLVQLDDIAEQLDQVNMPSTTTELPNWRRKQAIALEELRSDHRLQQVSGSMKRNRG